MKRGDGADEAVVYEGCGWNADATGDHTAPLTADTPRRIWRQSCRSTTGLARVQFYKESKDLYARLR